jgi:hypothetical protein
METPNEIVLIYCCKSLEYVNFTIRRRAIISQYEIQNTKGHCRAHGHYGAGQ